jgi:hypothetical protein
MTEARSARTTRPSNNKECGANVRHADKRVGIAALPSGSEYCVPDCGRRSTLNTKAAQVELFLTDALHQVDASDRDRRVAELLESQHHGNALLDTAVLVLNHVIVGQDFWRRHRQL